MPTRDMNRILVTGAMGQIGAELTQALRERYGADNVIASDVKSPEKGSEGPLEYLDVTSQKAVSAIIEKHKIDAIFHLAAILSASGEENPQLCWHVNVQGIYQILEAAREHRVRRVICPSSIAVFGPETPRLNTPLETILRPTTMYGVTKVTGELLGNYYFRRFGLDVRGIRYPGVISSEVLPHGGTTDYAVEIFYDAVKHRRYTCFLEANTVLPMIYMPDVISGTIRLAEADVSSLRHHADFNIAGFSIAPKDLAEEIKKFIPDFEITYAPDHRQSLAESWPQSIDDSAAREEWGWQPRYDLHTMASDMLTKLAGRYQQSLLSRQVQR